MTIDVAQILVESAVTKYNMSPIQVAQALELLLKKFTGSPRFLAFQLCAVQVYTTNGAFDDAERLVKTIIQSGYF